MDEVAFVESLFQPELRSTPQPSPTPSLLISASATPTFSSVSSSWPSSPRLRSFKAMPMANGTTPAASPHNTLRVGVGVGPEEEEVFRQLLDEHEFDETLAMTTTQVENMVDHLHASSLLEPIELPKNGGVTSLFDAAFKDVFPMASPLTLSPSGFGTPNYKMFSPTSHTPRGSFLDPHRTPRNGMFNDSLMPVQPLGAARMPANNAMLATPPMSAIEALQQAIWSSNPRGNIQRLNPNSIKDVMHAATASAARTATAPSPVVSVLTPRMQFPFPSEAASMWLSTTLLTPTNIGGQNAPDLTRNISSKKSKARKPSHNLTSASTNTASASALTSSLATAAMPKKRAFNSSQPLKQSRSVTPVILTTSESQDSDEAESKANKGKKCVESGCVRRAQSNSRCKAHGGGARCQYDGPGGCTRSSQGGGFCRAHGGGKRCEYPDCTRGQQRKGRCYVHGGIRKCQTEGCEKKDRGNGFCISHGGGKRCVFPGCGRSVRRGNLCQLHEDTASVSSVS